MQTPTMNADMNAKIVGILRTGDKPSQYAAERIEELEAENKQLREQIVDTCRILGYEDDALELSELHELAKDRLSSWPSWPGVWP